jgi:hypothetical protein
MKLENCNTKSEYIKYILENSKYVKDIDTAVPLEISKFININGIEGYFATIYYNDECGNVVRYSDVISLATTVSKGEL